MKLPLLAAAAALFSLPALAAETPIQVFAAENFYAEAVNAIGGDRVHVESITIGSNVDPHDFEPPPSVARQVSDAKIVVFNGADYDHWMEHLLESTERPDRTVIEAAGLIGVEEGENPHVWYDPRTLPAVADAVATALAAADPEGAAGYEERKAAYVAGLAPIGDKVASMKQRFDGAAITATEPVFGYMADAIGLKVGNEDFQNAIMNETEPSAQQIAEVVDALRGAKVKALIYNNQVSDAMTEQLLTAAKEGNVPVIGVTETIPEGQTYAQWMLGQLESLEKALAGSSS